MYFSPISLTDQAEDKAYSGHCYVEALCNGRVLYDKMCLWNSKLMAAPKSEDNF